MKVSDAFHGFDFDFITCTHSCMHTYHVSRRKCLKTGKGKMRGNKQVRVEDNESWIQSNYLKNPAENLIVETITLYNKYTVIET